MCARVKSYGEYEGVKGFLDGVLANEGLERCMEACYNLVHDAMEDEEVTVVQKARMTTSVGRYISQLSDAHSNDADALDIILKGTQRIGDYTDKKGDEIIDSLTAEDVNEVDFEAVIEMAFEKTDAMLEDGSCTPAHKRQVLNEIIKIITATVDAMSQKEDPPLSEEFCDHMMEKCAAYRKQLMAMEDEENEMDFKFDTILLNGYHSGIGQFNSYR